MITKINLFKESILVPRNLEGRKDKLRQINYKLLQQEIIDGNLTIDDSFDFKAHQVKVKQINGDVDLYLNYIPEWLSTVIINGNFYCSNCNLTSLKNCPQIIKGYFNCSRNELDSLEYGPKEVGDSYWCYSNKVEFTQDYVKSLCDVKNYIIV